MQSNFDHLHQQWPLSPDAALYRALTRLKSVITIMHTGAHPDDEQSGLLACLRFQEGMRTIIACSTRGEGGQNALGSEKGAMLGAIRTKELEQAAKILDSDIRWLGFGQDDPVHDFGFSKNGDDTFDRWGKKLIIERLARAYRVDKPDIVLPTFLDVSGQHGHHRAMTRAAEQAIALAADPGFESDGLAPWKVSKFYLPAWGGDGDYYDDETPPPSLTTSVIAKGKDYSTGSEYDEIGEWARTFHATQGMGVWKERFCASWPLHLVSDAVKKEVTICDNLPSNLAELTCDGELLPVTNQALVKANASIHAALTSYPNRTKILNHLERARCAILDAVAETNPDFIFHHKHRLERKLSEIDRVIFLACGFKYLSNIKCAEISAGAKTELEVSASTETELTDISLEPICSDNLSITQHTSSHNCRWYHTLAASHQAELTSGFTEFFSPEGFNGELGLGFSAQFRGHTVCCISPADKTVRVIPTTLSPVDSDVVLLSEKKGCIPLDPSGEITLCCPQGWHTDNDKLYLPENLAPGLYRLPIQVHESPAFKHCSSFYPHIGSTSIYQPADLKVLILNVRKPQTQIGYIGGGADNISIWLKKMEFHVSALDTDIQETDLSPYSTLVIGAIAFGTRSDLYLATEKMRRFVENGGHLVTFYQRPFDGWKADYTSPRPLTIGSPSLRWRVTDPNAEVRALEPQHRLLNKPNKIISDDWSGWKKERGLYFASEWDSAYEPLLAMADKGESELYGSLLTAKVDKGRHTHISLSLHHQLDHLVLGAFKMLANLVQPSF